MKVRKKPLKWILAITLVVALLAMGATYAYWTDDLVIETKVNTDTFNPIAVSGNVVNGLNVYVNDVAIANTNNLSVLPGASGAAGEVEINLTLPNDMITNLNSGGTVKIVYPINLDGYAPGSIQSITPEGSSNQLTLNPAIPSITSDVVTGSANAGAVTLSVNRTSALQEINGTYYAVVELGVPANSFTPTITQSSVDTDKVAEGATSVSVDVSTTYTGSFPITLAYYSDGDKSWTSTLNCNLSAAATATLSVDVPQATPLAAPLSEAPVGEGAQGNVEPDPEPTPDPAPAE